MTTASIKSEAHRLVDELGDDATWEDLIYAIWVRERGGAASPARRDSAGVRRGQRNQRGLSLPGRISERSASFLVRTRPRMRGAPSSELSSVWNSSGGFRNRGES